ncbi:MAG: nucleoside triphosphate pyrophosphatase [Pseudomonadota bacterium]
MTNTVLLASASPRRSQILQELGVCFTAAGVDLDESRLPGERADAMVVRLAAAKAEAAAAAAETPVLGADTAVVLGDAIFGKPVDRDDALDMLRRLSGREHQVMTGVALRWGGRTETELSTSHVRFRDIDPDEALAYWQSGEPSDKAGSYAIQGAGGDFVASLEGSYSGVVGLPIDVTIALLAKAGITVQRIP